MILDANGKPVRKPIGFVTPQWVVDEAIDLLSSRMSAWREYINPVVLTDDLGRPDVNGGTGIPGVGDTITVRLPKRLQKAAGE